MDTWKELGWNLLINLKYKIKDRNVRNSISIFLRFGHLQHIVS